MNKTADIILAALRSCATPADVEAVSNKHRAEVVEMRASDPVRYTHIINAKAYYLEGMRNDDARTAT